MKTQVRVAPSIPNYVALLDVMYTSVVNIEMPFYEVSDSETYRYCFILGGGHMATRKLFCGSCQYDSLETQKYASTSKMASLQTKQPQGTSCCRCLSLGLQLPK